MSVRLLFFRGGVGGAALVVPQDHHLRSDQTNSENRHADSSIDERGTRVAESHVSQVAGTKLDERTEECHVMPVNIP